MPNPLIPEPPEIKPIPSGPSTIISFKFLPLKIISAKLYLGIAPNITSILANPKSASKIITDLPFFLNCIARFIAILDFPTPPLPLVTVITLASFFDCVCPVSP